MNDGFALDINTEDPVVQPDENDLAELTARNAQESLCRKWLSTPEGWKTAIQHWHADLLLWMSLFKVPHGYYFFSYLQLLHI